MNGYPSYPTPLTSNVKPEGFNGKFSTETVMYHSNPPTKISALGFLIRLLTVFVLLLVAVLVVVLWFWTSTLLAIMKLLELLTRLFSSLVVRLTLLQLRLMDCISIIASLNKSHS